MIKRIALLFLFCIAAQQTLAQGALLQSGPWTPNHLPMYVGQGSAQPVVKDSGGAGGGAAGSTISELAITAQGTGSAPFAGQGHGPYGTNWCDYDAPTTNATGYHYFCISPNAQGGPLIAMGTGGTANPLPVLKFILNGTTYQFPYTVGGIVGPNSSTVGHLAVWNNTSGSLLADSTTLPNGTTATTQVATDNSTKVATDAFLKTALAASTINYVINPMDLKYGAKCDGSTDDAAAFQAALNDLGTSAGGALFIPPTSLGCVIGTTLTSSHDELFIYGAGGESILIITAASGGIDLTGSCGVTTEQAYLQNFSMVAKNAANPAFGIRLTGFAAYGLTNVSFDTPISGQFIRSIQLSGSQQGYVVGGYDIANQTGVYLDSCGAGVTSNGVLIGNGRTFAGSAVGAAIDIESGASSVEIKNTHIVSYDTGIINNATGGFGGGGANTISGVHLEANTTIGIDNKAGVLIIDKIAEYDSNSIRSRSGAYTNILNSSPIDGTITFDAGSHGSLISNLLNGGVVINATTGEVVQLNNTGNGQPQIPTYFNSAAVFTSRNIVSAGDILTLNPVPFVAGNWGMTITGAGAADVYLRLQDVTLNGNTAGGVLTIKSGIGGTEWGRFNTHGVRVPTITLTDTIYAAAAGTVVLSASTGGTVGGAGGASALPATPLGYLLINVAGSNAKIPYYSP